MICILNLAMLLVEMPLAAASSDTGRRIAGPSHPRLLVEYARHLIFWGYPAQTVMLHKNTNAICAELQKYD